MELHQDPSSFSSRQELLEELENLISIESSRNGNPWISVAKLSELFCEKYRVSLEEVAKVQGYNYSLMSLFTSSRRFSIYGTQMPQDFYVALLQAVVPSYDQAQTSSSKYRIKRPLQKISEYKPILVSEIKSIDDFEIALIEIIKSLTANHQTKFATIAILSKNFRGYYGQPIRTVMRSICPEIKLIDLLRSTPNLSVQEVDNDWQITVDFDSVTDEYH
ncbi:MAG: hypothetical protein F6J96_05965 [Symploca sp. SIO1C2]|nr:hypothetical protein [Symploca sp. SIO1C2]